MNRSDQHAINQRTVDYITASILKKKEMVFHGRYSGYWKRPPSYKSMVIELNDAGYRSSRGDCWTVRSLYRMLQRHGHRGLYGLAKACTEE